MKLLDLLNNRYSIAKSATQKHIDEVKTCLEDYRCEKINNKRDKTITNKHVTAKRYEFPIPYIYSTHESMLSSLFDKSPELIISGKGLQDDEKAELIKSVYKYLYDKLDLESFLIDSAWWIILVGFISSYQTYEVEIERENPVLDAKGSPMMDEEGEDLSMPEYKWDDPKAYIDDPMHTFYAPDAQYCSAGKQKIAYVIREKLMDRDEVARTFNVKKDNIEATERLEMGDFKVNSTDGEGDIMRVMVKYYYGTIPEEYKSEVKDWNPDEEYLITYISNKILNIAENETKLAMAKWFSSPIDFFGFGIGKTLRATQKEMSIRRGQQVRYADLYAFPWLTLSADTKIDQNALQDVEKRKPLVFTQNPPAYLVPPQMPQTITMADEISRSDAQFISGTLDLSKGAQDTNTVKTATGQQLFAQSQDKRINKLRKAVGKYFKYVVVNLMCLARDNWTEEKIISITDEDGNSQEITVTGESLKGIDFDTDIDIQLDTITVNENALAERAIALYDKVKDDPMVDRRAVFTDFLLKKGFKIKNPEKYILDDQQAGSQPTQGEVDPNVQPEMQSAAPVEDPQMDTGQDAQQLPNINNPYGQF